MTIDAHRHFWKLSRGDYAWMTGDVEKIRRDILPPDLERFAPGLGIGGTVLVQAAPTVAETEFLLSLAAESPLVRGVVGWVDLADPDVGKVVDRLAGNPILKGIRPMLEDIDETEWILRPAVLRGLDAVQAAGLRFDALILPRHLKATLEFARRFPGLPIVIDHCAKPVIRGGRDPGNAWRDGMSALAERPGVFCKLSGLANEYGAGWGPEALATVARHVLSIFGPKRLMWGSDWPVLELAGDYAGWLNCAHALTAPLDRPAKASVFGGTATTFYGLDKK